MHQIPDGKSSIGHRNHIYLTIANNKRHIHQNESWLGSQKQVNFTFFSFFLINYQSINRILKLISRYDKEDVITVKCNEDYAIRVRL